LSRPLHGAMIVAFGSPYESGDDARDWSAKSMNLMPSTRANVPCKTRIARRAYKTAVKSASVYG